MNLIENLIQTKGEEFREKVEELSKLGEPKTDEDAMRYYNMVQEFLEASILETAKLVVDNVFEEIKNTTGGWSDELDCYAISGKELTETLLANARAMGITE